MQFFYRAILLGTIAAFSSFLSLAGWADNAISDRLTLREAVSATLEHNPQLARHHFRVKALEGERQTAALKPQFHLATQLENIVGTDDFKGVDSSELTLSLSSLIELGTQRKARLDLITIREQQLESTQRVLTLDILTQVTHQFIKVAAVQEQLLLLKQAQQFAQETVNSLAKQLQAGRTPEAELLRAKATLVRSTIDIEKAKQLLKSERVKLSIFWAQTQPEFTQVQADLFSLPSLAPRLTLVNQLANNPDLAVLADDVSVRSAERQQIQAERKQPMEWNAGIRRFQVTNDSAFLLGISLPLGSSGRQSGAMMTANANQAGAEQQYDNARIELHAHFLSVYEAFEQTLAEVNALRNDILPTLKQAMRATAEAFNQGRYSYLELSLAQRELLDSQLTLIDTTARAHALSTDIERLTGNTLSPITTSLPHSKVKTQP